MPKEEHEKSARKGAFLQSARLSLQAERPGLWNCQDHQGKAQ